MPGATTRDARARTGPGEDEFQVSAGRRVAGTILTGGAGALAMYADLAMFALAQGRSPAYPLQAVQGMMSGRRVIPDYPAGSGGTTQAFDFVLAPTYFLIPGLACALVILWWVTRWREADLSPRGVCAPAVFVTAGFFVVLVLLLGFREVDPGVQRVSSGYGVRAIGLPAWLLGHLAYAAVLTLGLGPITGMLSKRRHSSWQPLRGESQAPLESRSAR